jgi:L-2-hydroxyglutarate oxidase LhgO
MGGGIRFGPDVQWLKSQSNDFLFDKVPNFTESGAYIVDESRAEDFYHSIKRFWPDIKRDSFVADYAGIRPKLVGPNSVSSTREGKDKGGFTAQRDLTDFVIEGPVDHGIPGLVNLFGIESPGLTSSLAIADFVALKVL